MNILKKKDIQEPAFKFFKLPGGEKRTGGTVLFDLGGGGWQWEMSFWAGGCNQRSFMVLIKDHSATDAVIYHFKGRRKLFSKSLDELPDFINVWKPQSSQIKEASVPWWQEDGMSLQRCSEGPTSAVQLISVWNNRKI